MPSTRIFLFDACWSSKVRLNLMDRTLREPELSDPRLWPQSFQYSLSRSHTPPQEQQQRLYRAAREARRARCAARAAQRSCGRKGAAGWLQSDALSVQCLGPCMLRIE